MKNFKITEKQLQEIIDYLAKRPYVEVYKLVSLIQSLELVPVATSTEKQPEAPQSLPTVFTEKKSEVSEVKEKRKNKEAKAEAGT